MINDHIGENTTRLSTPVTGNGCRARIGLAKWTITAPQSVSIPWYTFLPAMSSCELSPNVNRHTACTVKPSTRPTRRTSW